MAGLFSDISEYRKTEQSLMIQRDQYDDLRESSREDRRDRKKQRQADAARREREERDDFLDAEGNRDIREAMTFQERLEFHNTGKLPDRFMNESSAPAPVAPATPELTNVLASIAATMNAMQAMLEKALA